MSTTEVANELVDPEGNPVVTTTEIVSFKKIEANLIELESHFKDKTWNMADLEQKADAAATSKKFAKLRTALENSRKDEKAESLRIGKVIDANAATFKGRISKIEDRINAEIEAENKRLAAIEEAKIRAEQERVGAIRSRIDAIKALGVVPFNATAQFITEALGNVPYFEDGSYAEFSEEAINAMRESRGALVIALESAAAREVVAAQAEVMRVANEAQAAELAELRREKAERNAREAAVEVAEVVAAPAIPVYASRFLSCAAPLDGNTPVPDDRPLALSSTLAEAPIQLSVSPFFPAATTHQYSPAQYPGDVAIVATITDRFKVSDETAIAWLAAWPTVHPQPF
jgi:hypothetical protein